MKKSKILFYILAGSLFSTAAFSKMDLSPDEIILEDVSLSKSVLVTNDGKPISPADITKIVTGVFKFRDDVPSNDKDGKHFSNYSHMFDFEANDDGTITIKARGDLLEVGKYDLYVHTIHGTATGLINATLTETNPTRARKRVKLPEFSYAIVLPDYKHGQTIVISLPPDKVHTYSWYINGELHSTGLGETTFRTKPDEGSYEISYIAENPEGDVVSSWSDTTEVSK